ncbi:tRNA sulfurtransferase [Stutzerimonas stutzeri]
MKLIVKVFPEITIKSPPVRKGFIRQLAKNIRTVLRELDPELRVEGVWDNIEVETALTEPKLLREMIERLRCTPGIAHCLEVHEYPLGDLDDIVEICKAHYAERLPGKISRCVASAPASIRSPRWTSSAMSAASCASSAAPPVSR